MKRVGSYEAKTHLPSLLAEVEAGATIMITRHGVDIARLSPATDDRREDVATVVARMKARRARRVPVSAEEVLSWRNEGRKPLE